MVGSDLFRKIAERLKWGREDAKQVSRFIELHMWPFHLNNVRQKTGLTPRAALRLVKAAGSELPGLFMLAMADTLAGRGDRRPPGLEENIVALHEELCQVFRQSIKPVLEKPKLLTGTDLQEFFSLTPGPIFRTILDGLQQAQVEDEIRSRADAIEWVRAFIQQGGSK
jgi:poly(A) polymerase